MESKKFNLDFKFGGNIEFLNRLETLMSRVDKAFKSSEAEIDKRQLSRQMLLIKNYKKQA